MSFGQNLFKARKSKHLTQKQVADSINIERSTYTKWENDSYEPTFEYVKVLASFYGLDFNFLFSD